MGRLLYSAICSLDGYIADREGRFDWAVPSEEVVAATVELDTTVGTHLYGRRTYELMTGWENDPAAAAQSPQSAEFARSWVGLDKVVYSTSLQQTPTARTRLERRFDPAEVQALVDGSDRDVAIGGPTLAGAAFAAGLVELVQLFLVPAVVGGGLSAIPTDTRVDLRLLGDRRFEDGTMLLEYAVRGPSPSGCDGLPTRHRR